MRKIKREQLSQQSLDFLRSQRTDRVMAHEQHQQRVAEVQRLWKTSYRDNKAFAEVIEKLHAMAAGRRRCMYCEDSQGTDIDHFRPKSRYPEEAFSWPNYLLACSHCNSNEKREQFPVDDRGHPLLIDPADEGDEPMDHLAFSPRTGSLVPMSPKGRVSSEVFGLGRAPLVIGRRDQWVVLLAQIVRYAQLCQLDRRSEANDLIDAIGRGPFSSVLCYMLELAKTPGGQELIPAECLVAINNHRGDLEQAARMTRTA